MCKSSCRRRRPAASSIDAEMMKSGHDYGVDEPLELRTAAVVDSSDYVARVLCTGCGRDFDVLRSDKTGYTPVVSAHAHGTLGVGVGSFAGCRSLSFSPLETEPLPRRCVGSASRSTRKSSFQTVPERGPSTECGGACSCVTTSSMSDACVDSTSSTFGRNRRDAERERELWRSADEAHLTLS